MNTLKIEKRISEELAGLRKLAAFLPDGKRNALLNKCAKIGQYASKAQALMDNPVGNLFPEPVHAPFDAQDNVDLARRAEKRGRLLNALLAGRTMSIENADEIGTTAFATLMSQVRAEIERKGLPYILCDTWVKPGGDRARYKKYWLMDKTFE